MSNRAWNSDCLVLYLRTFGEGHRNAVLLLPESENACKIQEAALFGGPKSKLRGLIVPYHSGKIWLYSNPVSKSTKINDFKVKEYRSGIRENLTRIWCASLAVELATKLEGNIDWNHINFFLSGISVSDENQCKLALMRFLWRVIIFSGLAPDVSGCAYCDNTIEFTDDCYKSTANIKNYFYLAMESALVCSDCIHSTEKMFKLSQETCYYLYATQNFSPKISRNMSITEKSYSELKQFLFYLIQTTVNKPLKTLQSGSFIF